MTPVISGIVGYVINWTGVWMLYRPLYFTGVHIPGMRRLTRMLPGKLRDVPGLRDGGIGWQGIIPSRSGKLGSIAVDKQIAKVGGPKEFYGQLDPEQIADHIWASSQQEMRELVERTMENEYPELWDGLPPDAREAFHERIREESSDAVHEVSQQIGENLDQLLDVKLMVVRLTEERPYLTNRLFHEVGQKEFRFMIRFGFAFGFVAALPLIPLMEFFPEWWILPIVEAIIGYLTNWIGIWLIYEPIEPKKIGPFTFHGLFLRRQHVAAEAYGDVISEEIITLRNIGEELFQGPRSDRTRALIQDAIRPAVDRAAGPARVALSAARGSDQYEEVRESMAVEAPEYTLDSFQDEEFNRRQNRAIRDFFTQRMRELSSEDFSETMRAATREDEWMLIVHGGIFGVMGGLLHYFLFGV